MVVRKAIVLLTFSIYLYIYGMFLARDFIKMLESHEFYGEKKYLLYNLLAFFLVLESHGREDKNLFTFA